jgi:hypothetical protein
VSDSSAWEGEKERGGTQTNKKAIFFIYKGDAWDDGIFYDAYGRWVCSVWSFVWEREISLM